MFSYLQTDMEIHSIIFFTETFEDHALQVQNTIFKVPSFYPVFPRRRVKAAFEGILKELNVIVSVRIS